MRSIQLLGLNILSPLLARSISLTIFWLQKCATTEALSRLSPYSLQPPLKCPNEVDQRPLTSDDVTHINRNTDITLRALGRVRRNVTHILSNHRLSLQDHPFCTLDVKPDNTGCRSVVGVFSQTSLQPFHVIELNSNATGNRWTGIDS